MSEDRIWRSSKEIIMDAYERIRKYQSGELLPARTDTLILTRRYWAGSTHNMRWL